MTPNPQSRPCGVEFEAAFGFRSQDTDCGWRAGYGLPTDEALDRIAGLRITPGPGKIRIRPAT
eukprot:15458552-Alexandrium_andersonii.AAC.1